MIQVFHTIPWNQWERPDLPHQKRCDDPTLGQCRRNWPDFEPSLGQCLVLVGYLRVAINGQFNVTIESSP